MKITSNKHTSGTLAVAQNGYLTLAVAGPIGFLGGPKWQQYKLITESSRLVNNTSKIINVH
ncbi:MAG: hypothetical protein H7331_04655 [Bacteroidia bacterium]|nr:hypothetical protein [Bacteroidia bacterium]